MALRASDLVLRSCLRVEGQAFPWSLWAWASKDFCLLTQCELTKPMARYPPHPFSLAPSCPLPLPSQARYCPCPWLCCQGRGWSQSVSAPPGYNQILLIPAGATSIRVEEVAASRNFLGECGLG